MKFLCVPCDTRMELAQTRPPDRGSISLVYSCPDCGYEFAMLTNPMETQVVGSLGVEIGGESSGQAAKQESKCPFSGMVQEMSAASEVAGRTGFPWTETARRRLETVPDFVRPMAKTGIEKYAKDEGYTEVNDEILDAARRFFGM